MIAKKTMSDGLKNAKKYEQKKGGFVLVKCRGPFLFLDQFKHILNQ